MALINSIPVSQIVQVNPSVLTASGSALELVGLFLFNGTRTPIGQVLSFPSVAAVQAYYGAGSVHALAAAQYFAGYVNAEQIPEAMLFAQYPATAVSAWLRGGSLASMTVAQLQALSGSLTVVIDGYTHTIASINFSGASSFSAAAAQLQTAFATSQPTVASVTASMGATSTGSTSGASTTITLSAVVGTVNIGDTITGTNIVVGTTIAAFGTGTGGNGTYTLSQSSSGVVSGSCPVTSNYLNVTAVSSGTVQIGQVASGTGIVNLSVTAFGTGTGLVGTYLLSGSKVQQASETVTMLAPNPTVTFDSISSAFQINSSITGTVSTIGYATGTLSASLNLTQATGAVTSQGAAAATPGGFMTNLLNITQNWVSFTLLWDPDGGAAGGPIKVQFAQWTSQQDDDFLFVAWDTDVGPQNNANDSSCMAAVIATNAYQGTACVSANDYTIASALMGTIASIDTSLTNGRITMAFRQFPSATPTVTNGTAAANLTANGYSFYGAYGSRANNFTCFANGFVSGLFAWIDSYIDQIWLNANLQQAIFNGLTQTNSVPYNAAGYSLIEAWCQDPINQALNFGAIRTGVNLSAAQIAEVTQSSGVANIGNLLQTRGYYLQVQDAAPSTRAARQSPPCNLWYCDGGSVQQITLDSIELQ